MLLFFKVLLPVINYGLRTLNGAFQKQLIHLKSCILWSSVTEPYFVVPHLTLEVDLSFVKSKLIVCATPLGGHIGCKIDLSQYLHLTFT